MEGRGKVTIEEFQAKEELFSPEKDENRALHKTEVVYEIRLSAKSE